MAREREIQLVEVTEGDCYYFLVGKPIVALETNFLFAPASNFHYSTGIATRTGLIRIDMVEYYLAREQEDGRGKLGEKYGCEGIKDTSMERGAWESGQTLRL